MILQSTLQNSLKTRSTEELIAIKQDALHQAAKYPAGSLRRRYWLEIVDRVTAIMRYQIQLDFIFNFDREH